MGITRHSLHKRRATGGKKVKVHKKRKYDMGRAPANTKLSNEQRTHEVRTRGGHTKYRALHLHTGNFSWPGEGTRTPPTQIRCHVHVSRGPPLPIGIHCSTSSSLGSSIPPRPCEHSKHRGEIAALRRKAAEACVRSREAAGHERHGRRLLQELALDRHRLVGLEEEFCASNPPLSIATAIITAQKMAGRCLTVQEVLDALALGVRLLQRFGLDEADAREQLRKLRQRHLRLHVQRVRRDDHLPRNTRVSKRT